MVLLMDEPQSQKPDGKPDWVDRLIKEGEYELLLLMAKQKNLLPILRQTLKDAAEVAARNAVCNPAVKKELAHLLKIAKDKRLAMEIRSAAENEAKKIIANEIERCVSNGWYANLLEMGKKKMPKGVKKAVKAAVEPAAVKAIELCAASKWYRRILEIARDKKLPRRVRKVAIKKAEELLSSQAEREAAIFEPKKEGISPPSDFLKGPADDKKQKKLSRRLLRIFR